MQPSDQIDECGVNSYGNHNDCRSILHYTHQKMAMSKVISQRIFMILVSLESHGSQLSNDTTFIKISYDLTSFMAIF